MKIVLLLGLMLSFGLGSVDEPNVEGNQSKITSESNRTATFRQLSHAYGTYQEALEVAKKENKNLFILFESEQCRWCKKLQKTTLLDPLLLKRLNEEFVVAILERDKSEYPKQFQIKGVPTVYMMSNQEKIYVERMGYHKDPKDYTKWFNYVKIESEL